jgi:hypothetical protein
MPLTPHKTACRVKPVTEPSHETRAAVPDTSPLCDKTVPLPGGGAVIAGPDMADLPETVIVMAGSQSVPVALTDPYDATPWVLQTAPFARRGEALCWSDFRLESAHPTFPDLAAAQRTYLHDHPADVTRLCLRLPGGLYVPLSAFPPPDRASRYAYCPWHLYVRTRPSGEWRWIAGYDSEEDARHHRETAVDVFPGDTLAVLPAEAVAPPAGRGGAA